MCLRALVCLCVYVSVGVFACARVCMRLYVMTSSYFLTMSGDLDKPDHERLIPLVSQNSMMQPIPDYDIQLLGVVSL